MSSQQTEAMSQTQDRRHALKRFVERTGDGTPFMLEAASADASFRSYWRATWTDHTTRIVMDAPPELERLDAWLDIGARLRKAGLHAPAVYAVDAEQGFVLMEDLGARAYLTELREQTVDALYADALDALLGMQTQVDTTDLPAFDDAFVRMELELMPEWFLHRHLGLTLGDEKRASIDRAFAALVAAIREQPQGFMHRDYHSRNLMIVADHKPGIIDFQGAVVGPVAYDLASLLRDCYIAWDGERVDGWVEDYRQRLEHAHLIDHHVDAMHFRRWFDLTGLQRHLKVLGLFCRLWYRDGKLQYLMDLPIVWDYVIHVARAYNELAPLADLLERALGDRDIAEPREAA